MDKRPQMRTIDVFVFEDVNLLDVAGPVQAFETAQFNTQRAYKHRFVSLDGASVRASCGMMLGVDGELTQETLSDDVMIPGGQGVDRLIGVQSLQETLQVIAQRSGDGRLISICSGALLLADAGVLNGHGATTHWSRVNDVQRYPDVVWDLDRISSDNGRIFTSAGVTTGIDLALAIIRSDCGNEAALAVARELVMQLRRTGGQSQYAMHLAGQFTKDDSLTRLIEHVIARPHLNWTLETLAQTAAMNTRTLSRRFKQHLDRTPAEFVERIRVDHARGLIEAHVPLKRVAADSGFGDLQRLRRAFRRQLGTDISSYGKAFRET